MKKAFFLLLTLALVVPVQAKLVNRYSFTSGATTVVDSVGGKHGTLVNGATIGGNKLVLSGGGSGRTGPHAALPADVLSDYATASFEFWYTIDVDQDWQRVFDFGATQDGAGGNYIMFTPTSGASTSRYSITTGGFPGYSFNEQWAETTNSEVGTEVHVVCVYDDATSKMTLYRHGQFASEITTVHKLTSVARTMALLGAALYNDPAFTGVINEFRIYNHAMAASEVAYNYALGPDVYNEVKIESVTPADGAVNVAVNPTLSWTVAADITPLSYKLYVGTDPNILDPNVANIASWATVANQTLATNSYALSGLARDKFYYWRVDTVTASQTYMSFGYTFKTLPFSPVIVTPPANQFVKPGDNAVYTFVAEKPDGNPSDITIRWYKEMGAVDQELVSGVGKATIVTEASGMQYTSTLTLADVEAADDGVYYATATNSGGTSPNAEALLYVKRLVAYYPFEGNADDASGSGLHGTGMALAAAPNDIPPTFAEGKVGQAAVMSNTYQNYFDLPDDFADFRGGLTFNVWAYPTQAGNWANFVQFSNGTPSDNIFFCREGTGTNLIFRTANGATQNTLIRGTVAIELEKWQMFTATLDASGVAKLYKNGVRYAFYNNNGTINTPQVTMPIPNVVTRVNNYIGKSAWGDAYFNGQLDELRVYNYALTADEIAAQYFADAGVPACQVKPAADLDGDCIVSIGDVAVMASQWLQCGLYPQSECQ